MICKANDCSQALFTHFIQNKQVGQSQTFVFITIELKVFLVIIIKIKLLHHTEFQARKGGGRNWPQVLSPLHYYSYLSQFTFKNFPDSLYSAYHFWSNAILKKNLDFWPWFHVFCRLLDVHLSLSCFKLQFLVAWKQMQSWFF